MKKARLLGVLLLAVFVTVALGHGGEHKSKSPDGAKAYIISPSDRDTVSSPFTVRFGLEGMGVAPAGVKKDNTGHHHLLIDVKKLPALDKPIPSNASHRHFGKGQTEVKIELKPGKHTLQLVLADHNHIPHDPPVVSKKITITVK